MKQDFIQNVVNKINKSMKKTRTICVEKVLNKRHIDPAQQGFTQVKFIFYYYFKILELILVNMVDQISTCNIITD
jgi:hypothetical protein